MEKRRKNAVILSTIGVVMLLIGVSYSFFNYTKTGISNTIRVGRIAFNSNQTNTITLLDVFPIDSADVDTSTDVGTATIAITGDTEYTEGIEYQLTVTNLTNTVGEKKVPVDISVTASGLGESDADYFTNVSNNPETSIYKIINSEIKRNNQQLLVGYIKSGSTGINGTVTIKAYLDKDKIAITDTYPEGAVYTINTNMTNEELSYCISTVGSYFWGATTEEKTAFCQGTGKINNKTFLEYLNGTTFAQSTINYFIANNIIDSFTNNTTSDWVDGRFVLTTDEWNSFQNNGISFQVKVEANEGLWVEEQLTNVQKVDRAIATKMNAETNSCNPIFVDDMGTNGSSDDIRYFSGNSDCVDMNYVWYSGKLWRITAIYPDGAMKLITDDVVTSIAPYQPQFTSSSALYQWLNEDFYDTLYEPSSIIDTSKKWNATTRITNYTARLPETNLVSVNVGTLDTYEFYNSYRCIDSATCTGSTTNSYLNNGYKWWLINSFNSSTEISIYINKNYYSVSYPNASFGVRPMIFIKPELEFGGEGTRNNPYTIVGDLATGKSNDLINTRLSGEYVKLKNGSNEQIFRIVNIENNKTKIVSLEYVNEGDLKRIISSTSSSSSSEWGEEATIGSDTWYTYLNETYLPNMIVNYGEIFDNGTYYYGRVNSSGNYKYAVCDYSSVSNPIKTCTKTTYNGTFNIGLLRYGEMFAINNTYPINLSKNMWFINKCYSSGSYFHCINGSGDSASSVSASINSATAAVRPTLHLKPTVKILSGSGTENDPYVVGL